MDDQNEAGLSAVLFEAYRNAQRGMDRIGPLLDRPENRAVAERFVWRMFELVSQTVRELGLEEDAERAA